MKVFDMPRGSGKTTVMLRWLMDDEDRVLIVPSGAHQFIRNRYLELTNASVSEANQRILRPGALLQTLAGRKVHLGIDELEIVLQELLGQPVDIATLTT